MLSRFGPPLELVDRDFDDVVRRTFGEFGRGLLAQQPGRAWVPPLDAYTKDGELHIRLEAPGLDPDKDVDIEVADGVLRIQGERHREEATEEEGYFRREMAFGRFERTIALPDGVDPESVRATYDAGVLHVTVPLPRKQSSKVKVELGAQAQQKELH